MLLHSKKQLFGVLAARRPDAQQCLKVLGRSSMRFICKYDKKCARLLLLQYSAYYLGLDTTTLG